MNNVTHASRIQQVTSARAVVHDHDVSLDVLRIVATLMVILIHTSGKGFAGLIPHWWAVNTYESVSRVCVPIFFMITGALLLPRSHNIRSVIKRSWRIAFVLLAWSLIFLAYGRFKAIPPSLPSVSQGLEWIIAIIRSPVVGHFWYLYTLIAAYFFIPVMSAFFKTTELRLQTLILIVWFIAASGIPFLNRYFNDAKFGIDIHFFYIYPAYMLAGALLYTHCTMNLPRFLACAAVWALSTAGTAFFTWHFSKDAQVNTELYYEYFAPLVVTGALALFCALRYLGRVIAERCTRARNVIVFLGGLSFGVYLIHPMIIWEFENQGYGWNFINPWMAIPSLMIGVALISGLITYIIKKTPVLRAIVPG